MTRFAFTCCDKYDNPEHDVVDAFEFARRINELGEKHPPAASGAIWLRGQSDGTWSLEPSIGRRKGGWLNLSFWLNAEIEASKQIKRLEDIEYTLLHRFRRYAHSILKRAPDRWETITMAQHHGLPTRLLDWSSNPLVALYFAAESQLDKDAAVFAFRPSKNWRSMPNMYQDDSSHKHEPDPLKVKGIKIIFPMMSSTRLVAQSGAFTIQQPWKPLQEHAKTKFDRVNLDIVELHKFRLPHGSKLNILRQLNRAGISHRTLFPDLGGMGVGILREQLLRRDSRGGTPESCSG